MALWTGEMKMPRSVWVHRTPEVPYYTANTGKLTNAATEYVRADLVAALEAKLAEYKAEIERLEELLEGYIASRDKLGDMLSETEARLEECSIEVAKARGSADFANDSNKRLLRLVAELDAFKAKAIALYPSLEHDWKRIERSSLEHAQTVDAGTEEDGA